jgi:ATP-dependent Clp protease ATP-binding subunit ClpA
LRSRTLSARSKRAVAQEGPSGLAVDLGRLLIGQDEAVDAIVPFVQMHQAGLSPEGRPIGVVLLLGPTGTGKTRTVEALAEILHGSSKSLLKVDCGEFQMEHEVAKLVGAPPGYLGHRETQPILSQGKLNAVTSEQSDISIVLLDEIEKAAPSMARLLLGVLDKATLRLGDNTTVNFERSLIFMTTNLGAKAMGRISMPDFGFEALLPPKGAKEDSRLRKVGMTAVRKRFSPEFINRIDCVVSYKPLTRGAYDVILDQILRNFGELVKSRLGLRSFKVQCTNSGRSLLLKKGISADFGARELKRTVQRNFIQPVAALVAEGQIPAGSTVILDAKGSDFTILLRQ